MCEKNTILFTLACEDSYYQIHTRKGQYDTLMDLITDHLSIPDFGLCGGLGACGTCMVEITEKHSDISQHTLCCDVRINDALSNKIITIRSSNQ